MTSRLAVVVFTLVALTGVTCDASLCRYKCPARKQCVPFVQSCLIRPCANIWRCVPGMNRDEAREEQVGRQTGSSRRLPRSIQSRPVGPPLEPDGPHDPVGPVKPEPWFRCKPMTCEPCDGGLLRLYDRNGCRICTCYRPCADACSAHISPTLPTAKPVEKLKCTGWGDPHYYTFDGAHIDFMGPDSYRMAERIPSCLHIKDFRVVSEHERRHGNNDLSYLKSIEFFIPPSTVVSIEKLLIIRVNGNIFTKGDALPPWISSIDTTTGLVKTKFGVDVKFDGKSTATIWIPPSYAKCVIGMCGNANGDPKDDFVNRKSKNCAELPNNMKMWCVGNSWLFSKATAPLRTVDPPRRRLTAKMEAVFNKVKFCGSLKDPQGPFGKCILKMRAAAAQMHEGCMFDVRAVKDNAKQLACVALETFAEMCGDLAESSTWRHQTGCLCSGDLVWERCGVDCTRTCHDPFIRCSFKCVAKCQCPRATPYQRGTSCLTQEVCRKNHLWASSHSPAVQ